MNNISYNKEKSLYQQDLKRYNGCPGNFLKIWLYLLRTLQNGCNPFYQRLYRVLFAKISSFKHLEISPLTQIGGVFI